MLLSGVDPLRIFLYNEGLARFATEEYLPPQLGNLDNMCMHLTNYAINKNNNKFQFNKNKDDDNSGHKRSFTFVMKYLEEKGIDSRKIMVEIRQAIIKTICAV